MWNADQISWMDLIKSTVKCGQSKIYSLERKQNMPGYRLTSMQQDFVVPYLPFHGLITGFPSPWSPKQTTTHESQCISEPKCHSLVRQKSRGKRLRNNRRERSEVNTCILSGGSPVGDTVL